MAFVDYKNAIHFKEDFSDSTEQSLGTIYVTGGGYVDYPITAIKPDSQFGWFEMVWKKTPTRTAGKFAFKNIGQIEVGLVARCEINVAYLNYNEYRVIRNIINRERYFTVKFFDTDDGEWKKREMYCSESSKKQFLTLKQSLIGVIDLSIKLVGTNRDTDNIPTSCTINYYDSTGSTVSSSDTYSWGDEATILDSNNWTTTQGSSSPNYLAGQETTMWKETLNLYPVVEE